MIVCLCGSTRFSDAFKAANLRETIEGKIVLSIGCDTKCDSDLIALGSLTNEAKEALDDLHKRKIDIADEVLILNVGGYVGDSTRSEIEYAKKHGKRLRWLEPTQSINQNEGLFDLRTVQGDSPRLTELKRYGIRTHHAPHCEEPWMAIPMIAAREKAGPYLESDANGIVSMTASAGALLEDCGMIFTGQSRSEVEEAALAFSRARAANREKPVSVIDGSRYCSKCGEFLGMTCDPFGRSECESGCFIEENA